MSNSIETQTEILNQLLQVMHNSVDEPYDSMECKFDYYKDPDDGSVSVGEKFSYQINGEVKSEYLVYDGLMVSNLVNKLHNIMTAHTGSNWKEFILSLDEKGRAHTKFIYDES
ncbi:hypothetical protein OKC46_05040 [Acinetobacter baumannii]|uniref:hypothetical protein n=1 Tax=Acinetobacter baumannii TaxID=470 RepID=UPI00237F5F2A|nr:hypothetical protein [Acinetobacter baumannii]MDE3318645.1 hypothetical protein [Acinetobacter baumannii]MDX2337627.1 hypothetical protein [Acinetobacter baumannii]MDX5549200.1 hypothetical protein [Acinetobacter baumannii]